MIHLRVRRGDENSAAVEWSPKADLRGGPSEDQPKLIKRAQEALGFMMASDRGMRWEQRCQQDVRESSSLDSGRATRREKQETSRVYPEMPGALTFLV